MNIFNIFNAIGILIITFLVFGIFIVKQQSVALIERFGKFNRTALPGLNIRIPLIDRISGYINLRIQQLDVHVETKTKDNVFVKIILSVQYQAIESKIYEAFYRLEAPTEQIQSFVFDVVRAKVPNIELDDLFSKKDEIAVDVKNELHETMVNFGYEIIKTLVTDIQPNENVKMAMNEINAAQSLRRAAAERAEAEKIMRVKQAEAEAEANVLHGQGISGQRKAIIEGLSHSLEDIQKNSPSLSGENIMKMILMIQYFDTLREIGASSKTNTIFVPHSPDNINNIADQLREVIFAAKD